MEKKLEPNEPKVIFLSGTSSSGKSTVAKLLQQRLDAPFLHMQLDTYIEMMPYINNELFFRMASGFHRSIAAMVSAGNNVIVDHVLIDNSWLEECVNLLTGHVVFVGFYCPLDELERREKQRDQRRQGFARSQFERIHHGKVYDVQVDTSDLSPEQCAEKILEFYKNEQPTAFRQMRQ